MDRSERSMACNYCRKQIPIPNLMIHEANCSRRSGIPPAEDSYVCPNCCATLPLAVLDRHDDECEGKQSACEFCNECYPAFILEEHMGQCERRPRHRAPILFRLDRDQPEPFDLSQQEDISHGSSSSASSMMSPIRGPFGGMIDFMPLIMNNRNRMRMHHRGPRVIQIESFEDNDRQRQGFINGIEMLMQFLQNGRPGTRKLRGELKGRPYQPIKDQESCSICICGMEKGDNAVRLGCKHVYHRDCINQWVKQAAICPQCRTEIQEE